jgi:hypothetical protein
MFNHEVHKVHEVRLKNSELESAFLYFVYLVNFVVRRGFK